MADAVSNGRPVEAGVEMGEEATELGLAFRSVFRTLSRIRGRDTHLGGAEISHAQFELLGELYERGELSAGELAAAARMAPGTVTQMLDHLAACGHVERARSETDRRVVVSRLTAAGRRKLQAKREAWARRWNGALEGLGPEELRIATRVLERIGAMFEEAAPEEAGQAPETGASRPPQTPRK
jgi:DNA-binding MarR family transcriptional regulator